MLRSAPLVAIMRALFLLLWTTTTSFSAASDPSSRTAAHQSFVQFPLTPHHVRYTLEERRELSALQEEQSSLTHRNRNRRLGADNNHAIQVGALYQGYGTHYVDLWVGTPQPSRQTLIVDTGSGVTAFPCSGCADCGKGHHVDDLFDESASTTFHQASCTECQRGHCSGGDYCKIGMSYQEGSSWSAFEARDQVYIGGPHDHALQKDNGGDSDIDPNHAKAFSFEMTFGCQTKLTGLFKTQLADGIMGMDNAQTAFWFQMKKAKLMDSQTFSLCFTRQPLAEKSGTEAGAMTMGGYDERLHSSPMVYTAKKSGGGGFLNVHIRKVYLRHGDGGEFSQTTNTNAKLIPLNVPESDLNRGNVIVDSGTTDTYFTRRIATEFKAAFSQLTGGKTYDHKAISLTDDEMKKLPTILIQIGGDDDYNKKLYSDDISKVPPGFANQVDPDHPFDILLAIPPSHYMEYEPDKKKYIARFYTDEGSGTVLGANSMMGHDVFFDLDHDRIGWAESDCDYHALISNNGFIDTIGGGGNNADNGASVKPETPSEDDNSKGSTESATDSTAATATTNGSSIHPAVAACSDWKCRGAVFGSLFGFLFIGLAVGRGCRRQRRRAHEFSVVEEMEMAAYRDEPNDFATPGAGYSDDDDDEVPSTNGTLT